MEILQLEEHGGVVQSGCQPLVHANGAMNASGVQTRKRLLASLEEYMSVLTKTDQMLQEEQRALGTFTHLKRKYMEEERYQDLYRIATRMREWLMEVQTRNAAVAMALTQHAKVSSADMVRINCSTAEAIAAETSQTIKASYTSKKAELDTLEDGKETPCCSHVCTYHRPVLDTSPGYFPLNVNCDTAGRMTEASSQSKVELSEIETRQRAQRDKGPFVCRECVLHTTNMDGSLWSQLPEFLIELIFARLPLACIFRLLSVSKRWKTLIFSPTFQQVFSDIPRLSLVSEVGPSLPLESDLALWTFDITRNQWSGAMPLSFLPSDYCGPFATAGGLMCFCAQVRGEEEFSDGESSDEDFPFTTYLRILVCNPLTKAMRKLPPTVKVQDFPEICQMAYNSHTKQYALIVGGKTRGSEIFTMEVYDSVTNCWSASLENPGHLTNSSIFCAKEFIADDYIGVGVYDMRAEPMYELVSDIRAAPIGDLPLPPGVLPPEESLGISYRDHHHDSVWFEPQNRHLMGESQGRIFMLGNDFEYIWEFENSTLEWKKVCYGPACMRTNHEQRVYVCGTVILLVGGVFGPGKYHELLFVWRDISKDDVWHDVSKDSRPSLPKTWESDGWHQLPKMWESGGWEITDHLRKGIMFELRLDAIP